MLKAKRIKKSPNKATILIAGGASYLGSNLARRLLDKDSLVVVLDNLAFGKREYIQSLLKNDNFVFINCDINQDLPPIIESADYIYHLAAVYTHTGEGVEISLEDLLTNALGTKNLLDLTRKSKAKFLLASSITVYQGVLSHLDLKYYFGATIEEQTKYSHAEAKRFAEALVWEYFKNFNLDVRIARLPNFYGPDMEIKDAGELGRFIQALMDDKNFIIYGEGLQKHYYSFIDDVVEGLVQALFGKETTGMIAPITDLSPKTTLELAYAVKTYAKPNKQIIFQPEKEGLKLPDLKIIDGESQKQLGWKVSVPFNEGLKRTIESLIADLPKRTPVEEPPDAPPPKKKPPTPFIKRLSKQIKPLPSVKLPKFSFHQKRVTLLVFFIFFIVSVTFFSPIIFFGIHTIKGVKNVKSAQDNLLAFKLDTALSDTQAAKKQLSTAQTHLKRLYTLSRILRQEKRFSTFNHALLAIIHSNDSLNHLFLGLQPLETVLENFFKADSDTDALETAALKEKFRTASAEISAGRKSLFLSEAEFKEVQVSLLPSTLAAPLQNMPKKYDQAKEAFNILSITLKSLPAVLGFEEDKKYLILFQNSNELRPTGGFIGSYGEVTVRNGIIENLIIDDIYNPDGKLDEKNIRIEPPEPIRIYLKQPNWYLRDANWNISFPESAQHIKRFYKLETDTDLDGVIGVDLNFIENMLEVTGPIYIASYNESVDKETLFEKAEAHSEHGYLPGAPYKKTFLSTLGQNFIDKLFSLEQTQYSQLLLNIKKSLDGKHLLIFLPSGELTPLLAEQGWDGSVKSTQGDYLMVVDANVGATKANFYVTRSINYQAASIGRDGRMESTLKLTYVHTGTSDAWPGGPYKNYLRILVPKGSKLIKARRTSAGLEEKGEDITNQIILGEEAQKTSFATVFTLNHGKSLSLNFVYELPTSLFLGPGALEYSLYVQKQPGTTGDPITVSFTVPFGREIIEIPENTEEIGDILRYSGNLKKDLSLTFPFK